MNSYNQFFPLQEAGKSYKDWQEQLQEYMKLLTLLFQTAEPLLTDGNRLLSLLPSPARLDLADQRILKKAMRHIVSREQATAAEGVFLPLAHVGKVFQLSAFERFCVILSLISELDRQFEKQYVKFHGHSADKLPTLGSAAGLYGLLEDRENKPPSLFSSHRLFSYLFEQKKGSEQLPRLAVPLRLEERVLAFLTDKTFVESGWEPCLKVEFPDNPPPLLADQEIQQGIRTIIGQFSEEGQKTAIYLYGPGGAGKKLQLRHAAIGLGLPLIWVDGQMLKREYKRIEELVRSILRCAILYQGLLCIHGFEAFLPGETEEGQAGQDLLNRLAPHTDLIFLLSRREGKLGPQQTPFHFMEWELKGADDQKRLEIWQQLTKATALQSQVSLAELSNKFPFTIGMMEQALAAAQYEARLLGTGEVDRGMLHRACIRQSAHQLEKKATKVKTAFTWADLIIPAEQKRTLLDACNHIRYKHVVLQGWGFDKKLPYGRGLSILFHGPPGTGKTMGAQVLAGELELELYRIDLSQTVSKYIGETEKHLKEIFDEAAQTSAILFFDEADSLFGKRGEVKEANDRYANMETSYLLQKMEEYEGITILATNLLQNFDEAYRRRFKFMIHFPLPDLPTRRELWHQVFPPSVPLASDVDLEFMAEEFEISGSNIKNIAVGACFLAAGEGEALQMKHLIRALRNELTKTGRILVRQELKGYGDLL